MAWTNVKLGDVCSKITDGSHNPPKGVEFSDFFMLSSKNVFDDNIHLDNPRYLQEADFEKENRRTDVSVNDVLLTIVGTVGRVAVVGESLPKFTLQRSVAVLKPISDRIIPRFLMYSLQAILEKLLGESRGVAQKGIYLKSLREMEICIPSSLEQKRIVAILDQAFADIEQARAKTEQNLKNARDLFESYLQKMFSQRGAGWEDSTLSFVAENLDSKRIPITKKDRIEGTYPYYGASGIVDYVDGYLFDEELLLVSEDGANLLARTYPIAFSATGKYWVNNHAHVLKFKDRNIQKFIEYYLNSISLAPYVSGMAQPKLNQRALNNIPVPKVNEQIAGEVVNKLEVLEKEIIQVEKIYEFKLTSLDELKKSILQKAFSGELTKTLEGATNKGAAA